jgi:DNA-binding HxlR family transcriptional regulator
MIVLHVYNCNMNTERGGAVIEHDDVEPQMESDREDPDTQAPDAQRLDALVRFYKALADPTRLRIVGMLAERPMYGQELANALGVKPPTVSHHLAELRAAGLLRTRKVDNYHYFELDVERLRRLSASLFEDELRPRRAPRDDERARTVSIYLADGRLTSIPTQRKRLIYVLEELVRAFEYGRTYTEAEVNEILGDFHEDVATLRRELIGYRLLARERGIYWRTGDHIGGVRDE